MEVDNYVEDIDVKEEPAAQEAPAPAQPEAAPQPAGDPVPAEETAPPPEAVLDEVFPPEAPPKAAPRRKGVRPELIMVILVLFATALLVFTIILCWPYFQEASQPEDPEALLERHQAVTETAEEPLPPAVTEEPAEETTEETAEPTIPPDSNPYGRLDFQYKRHNYLYCLRTESYTGVDVSAFQGDINWKKVKNSGIEFAIIRLGYRGWGKAGRMVEDDYAQKNLYEATKEGLPIGAYFFSQALTIQEVDEEIDFMLEILGDYTLDMPIILDWEIPTAEARTANMDARTLTDIQLHFCGRMRDMGYQPMVYFNWYQSEHLYYLSELEEYPFWLALYQDRMTYPWKVEMWQYTCTGSVPGIQGDVDINVYMPN